MLIVFFGGVGCVTSNNWLDFGGDPGHDVERGIFKRDFAVTIWMVNAELFT